MSQLVINPSLSLMQHLTTISDVIVTIFDSAFFQKETEKEKTIGRRPEATSAFFKEAQAVRKTQMQDGLDWSRDTRSPEW